MDFGLDFQLPSTFIEIKKNEIHENDNMGSFINRLYNRHNSKPEKQKSKQGKKKVNIQPKKPRRRETQQTKRLDKIKTLMRLQTLQQKQMLDEMKRKQRDRYWKQKSFVNCRIREGKPFQPQKMNLKYLDVINVEGQSARKQKTVEYVNMNRMKHVSERQGQEGFVEVDRFGNAKNIVPFEETYGQKKAMEEINRALHEKDTYRFNVLWWGNSKNGNNQDKDALKQKNADRQENKLDPETIKALKRQLKPLRRHKLIATRYAPLAEFMQRGMFEKDGIRDGRMIDSSESEDEMGTFGYYDDIADQTNKDPPGTIELEPTKPKRRRAKNKETQEKKNQNKKSGINFDIKNRIQPVSDEPTVERRLKRALAKMHKNDWKEDRLYTKGMDEDRPIAIDDFQ